MLNLSRSLERPAYRLTLSSPCNAEPLKVSVEVREIQDEYKIVVHLFNREEKTLAYLVAENVGESVVIDLVKPTITGHDAKLVLECNICDAEIMY